MPYQIDYRTKTIELPDEVSPGPDLTFLRAIVFEKPRLPFAIVNYAIGGVENEMGLRLDLGKRVFVDHFENPAREEMAAATAIRIVSFLASDPEDRTPIRRAQGAD